MSTAPPSHPFIIEFGVALHRYGAPAHRIESAISAMADLLDEQAQVVSTPTSVTFAFGPNASQKVAVVRVEPGSHNLAKLAEVDALADRVASVEVSPTDALAELHAIREREAGGSHLITILAFALVSASFAVFLGGGLADLWVAACIGVAIGSFSRLTPRTPAGGRIFELVAAFLSGTIAHLAALCGFGVSYPVALLAGLIVLVPGLTLTIAMVEIATRNLVSGTARLTLAAVVFLEMLFGIALSEELLSNVWAPPPTVDVVALSRWLDPVALLGACVGLTVLFRARPKDIWVIAVTAVASYYSARLGSAELGRGLGASLGGFVAAAIANGYARFFQRSAMVPLVPSLILLVPGSLGFRSLSSLWQQDVVAGVDAGFSMVVVAISLVAGILVANAAVAPRRSL